MHSITGATVNEQIKSVSAIKKYPRARTKREHAKARGRQVWKMIQHQGDDMVKLGLLSKESQSALNRLRLMTHFTDLEYQAGRRYALIVGRFERFCTDTRRNAKSPSYERGFGSDQELERHATYGTLADYEQAARDARKEYDKLMRVIAPYGSQAKSMLDDLCCSDIEPPPEYRSNLGVVLRMVAKGFGVIEQPRSNKNRNRSRRST
jgi:hypothetical protein